MLGVAAHRPAWAVLVGGWLVIGLWGVIVLVGEPLDQAPAALGLLGLFLFGFTALTRQGVPVTPDAVAVGGIAGVTAGLLPVPFFLARPPVPDTVGWTFALIAAAAAAAVVITAQRGRPRFLNAVLSGLLAALVAALLIESVVTTMLQYGPASWLPPMVSHALTPAARLAENRMLSAEPYLLVLLFGDVLALMLGVLALRSRRNTRRRTIVSVRSARPVDRPGHIDLGEV